MAEAPEFVLPIAGVGAADGGLADALARAGERWLGRPVACWNAGTPSASRRAEILAGADALLCLDAVSETDLGAWIRDACACDCPLLAVAGGAAERWLGEAGLVVATADADELAAAVHGIDRLPELRRRVLHAQRRRFAPTPDPAAATDGIVLHGPVAGSYSLARVNRLLTAALRETGVNARLTAAEALPERPTTSLANDWPPNVERLRAPTTGLAAFAWEETAFPAELIERCNARLNLVTTTSDWVTRTLQDNGLTVPVVTIGLGTDHVDAVDAEPLPCELGPGFRFLHVSSCLPRKGVDSLLTAWARAFGRHDPVRLIIKTTANEHHDIHADVAAWRRDHPDAAAVEVYCEEWPEGALHSLYQACQALVAPSRGEGFGLPLAEAMHHGLAVITTAWGGQRAFCSAATAWLVDYRLVPAASHMALPGSAWAEPDVADLAAQLRAVYRAPASERQRRAAAGAALLRERFSWHAVARRLQSALARHERAPLLPRQRRIAWVSSWNSRCGIAEYSRMLVADLPDAEVHVFANSDATPIAADGAAVTRCWRAAAPDGLAGLDAAITEAALDIVVVQFNWGYFVLATLVQWLAKLNQRGIPVVVTLHATDSDQERTAAEADVDLSGLAVADRLLVHSVADLERLRAHGLAERTVVLPHGLQPATADHAPPPGSEALARGPVIASFGFLLPHKGLVELIEAFGQLQRRYPQAHLLLLNAVHPDPASAAERERCEERIAALPDPARVTLLTRFLGPSEIEAWLQCADLVAFPYQHTRESASGAVRQALAVDRPVICTPLPIFDELGDAVARFPGTDAAALRVGLESLLASDDARRSGDRARRRWLAYHAWPRIAGRMRGVLETRIRESGGDGDDDG